MQKTNCKQHTVYPTQCQSITFLCCCTFFVFCVWVERWRILLAAPCSRDRWSPFRLVSSRAQTDRWSLKYVETPRSGSTYTNIRPAICIINCDAHALLVSFFLFYFIFYFIILPFFSKHSFFFLFVCLCCAAPAVHPSVLNVGRLASRYRDVRRENLTSPIFL